MRKIGNIIASFTGNVSNTNSVENTAVKNLNVKENSFKECLNIKSKSVKNDDSKEVDSTIKNTSKTKNSKDKKVVEEKVENKEVDNKEDEVIEELMSLLLNTEVNVEGKYEKIINENELFTKDTKTMLIDFVSSYNSTEIGNNEVVKEGKKETFMADIMELLKSDSSIDEKTLKNLLESVKESSSEIESPKELINFIKTNIDKESNTDNNEILEIKTTVTDTIKKENRSTSFDAKNSEASSEEKSQEGLDKEDTFLTSLIEENTDVKNEGTLVQVPKMVFEPLKDVKESAPLITNKTNMIEDVIKSVKYMRDESVKEIVLKVVPRSLGEVVISLSMDKGVMKANVTTNNADTYNLLAAKIEEMNRILDEFKVESFDLTYMNNSQYGEKNKEGNEKNNFQRSNGSSFISVDDDVIEEISDETYSNIDMLA